MNDFRIDRFHARYHAVTTQQSLELDRALGSLRAGALDAVLADVVGPELARVWAVCVREVIVEVTLGDGGVRAWTEAWAEAVAAAVRTALEGASVTSQGASGDTEVVVFATRGDALVDMVRRTALDDRRHVWAWRQAGLGADVVAALRDEPLLIPGVLRVVGPELFGRVVATAELVDLARLVVRAARAAGIASGALVARDAAPVLELAVADPGTTDAPDEVIAAVVASLPVGVRRWVAGRDAALAADDDLDDLAALAALAASPYRAGDPLFIAGVATALGGSTQTPAQTTTQAPTPATAAMPAPTPSSATVPSPADSDATVEPEAANRLAVPQGEATAWGGVWFLAHALRELDLVPPPSAPELALLVAAFTGASYADVAVRMLCGLSDDDPFEPGAEPTEPDPAALAALATWVDERVDGRWDEQPEESRAVWQRAASIHQHPGEIEVVFSLSDVDPVVRAAGLDLDPGWVAWLGLFVRFSYV